MDIGIKKNNKERVILMTTKATNSYTSFNFRINDTILFGRESAGVPEYVHKIVNERLTIPMVQGPRSINLSSSVSIVAGEMIRQLRLS